MFSSYTHKELRLLSFKNGGGEKMGGGEEVEGGGEGGEVLEDRMLRKLEEVLGGVEGEEREVLEEVIAEAFSGDEEALESAEEELGKLGEEVKEWVGADLSLEKVVVVGRLLGVDVSGEALSFVEGEVKEGDVETVDGGREEVEKVIEAVGVLKGVEVKIVGGEVVVECEGVEKRVEWEGKSGIFLKNALRASMRGVRLEASMNGLEGKEGLEGVTFSLKGQSAVVVKYGEVEREVDVGKMGDRWVLQKMKLLVVGKEVRGEGIASTDRLSGISFPDGVEANDWGSIVLVRFGESEHEVSLVGIEKKMQQKMVLMQAARLVMLKENIRSLQTEEDMKDVDISLQESEDILLSYRGTTLVISRKNLSDNWVRQKVIIRSTIKQLQREWSSKGEDWKQREHIPQNLGRMRPFYEQAKTMLSTMGMRMEVVYPDDKGFYLTPIGINKNILKGNYISLDYRDSGDYHLVVRWNDMFMSESMGSDPKRVLSNMNTYLYTCLVSKKIEPRLRNIAEQIPGISLREYGQDDGHLSFNIDGHKLEGIHVLAGNANDTITLCGGSWNNPFTKIKYTVSIHDTAAIKQAIERILVLTKAKAKIGSSMRIDSNEMYDVVSRLSYDEQKKIAATKDSEYKREARRVLMSVYQVDIDADPPKDMYALRKHWNRLADATRLESLFWGPAKWDEYSKFKQNLSASLLKTTERMIVSNGNPIEKGRGLLRLYSMYRNKEFRQSSLKNLNYVKVADLIDKGLADIPASEADLRHQLQSAMYTLRVLGINDAPRMRQFKQDTHLEGMQYVNADAIDWSSEPMAHLRKSDIYKAQVIVAAVRTMNERIRMGVLPPSKNPNVVQKRVADIVAENHAMRNAVKEVALYKGRHVTWIADNQKVGLFGMGKGLFFAHKESVDGVQKQADNLDLFVVNNEDKGPELKKKALDKIKNTPSPATLLLAMHGSSKRPGSIVLRGYPTVYLSPQELAEVLNQRSVKTGQRDILLLDTCFSSDFIRRIFEPLDHPEDYMAIAVSEYGQYGWGYNTEDRHNNEFFRHTLDKPQRKDGTSTVGDIFHHELNFLSNAVVYIYDKRKGFMQLTKQESNQDAGGEMNV